MCQFYFLKIFHVTYRESFVTYTVELFVQIYVEFFTEMSVLSSSHGKRSFWIRSQRQ